jgi:putative chitinase
MNLNLGHTQTLIKEAYAAGYLRNQVAYLLATAYHETAHTMVPVSEAYWVKNAEAWRKKNLRYYPWYGRGYVQLTWEDNYLRAGKALGVDLIKNKELALDPVIGAKIIVQGMKNAWFTKYKLSDFVTLQKSDFVNARKIINGKDKAEEIAALAREYDRDLKALEGIVPVVVDDPGVQEPEKPDVAVRPRMGLLKAFLEFLSKLFRKN